MKNTIIEVENGVFMYNKSSRTPWDEVLTGSSFELLNYQPGKLCMQQSRSDLSND